MSTLRNPEPRGRLVAKPATVAAARQRGLAPAPPVEGTNDVDRPAVDPGKNIAVRLPQAPVRRDPDRDRKFADLLRVLRATCEAFAEPPRPLAIGIDKQVSALAGGQFERPVIGWVLRWWTGRPDYLQALADGAVRINLDGTPAGESSEKDRASAAHRLAERQQRKENERAARKRIIG